MSESIYKIIRPIVVKSDKDTHFTGALATNASEEENISGIRYRSGMIEAIHITSDQNLDWDVYFFAKDGITDTDLDVEYFLGVVTFVAADAKQIAGAGQYYYSTNNCSYAFRPFPYVDLDALAVIESDQTTPELHIALVNRNATSKSAGGSGEVVVTVLYRPDAEVTA